MFHNATSIIVASALNLVFCYVVAGGDDSDTSAPAAQRTNPFTSAADARRGHLLVRAFCSVCHGRDGKGGRGPDLTGRLRRGNSDEAILKNILNGIPGTDMVGFPVGDDFAWLIISYMRSAATIDKPRKGNIENGAKLFAKLNCSVCHWRGTDGGRRGPDLSALAAPLDYVRKSIIDPDENFRAAPAYQHDPYQQVSIETERGRMFGGRWLNENAYFVLFMGDDDRLRRITKSNIARMVKPRISLMPKGFEKQLNENKKELDDLIAYIFSLRPVFEEEEESE